MNRTGDSSRVALRAVASCALIAASELAFMWIDTRFLPEPPLETTKLVHSFFALAIAVGLGFSRRLPARVYVLATYLVVAPLLPIMWFAEAARASADVPTSPFIAFHLGILLGALLLPGPLLLIAATITVFGVAGILQDVLLGPSWPIPTPAEPWLTMTHLVLGLGLVGLRYRLQQLEERAARQRTAMLALRQLARVSRRVRDGIASPLQTIEAAALLLNRHHPEETGPVQRIDRAVVRIRRLIEQVEPGEAASRDEENAFDAQREIAHGLDALRRDAEAHPERAHARRRRPHSRPTPP